MAELLINPALDLPALADEYATRRRVRIAEFVDLEALKAVHAELVRSDDWRQLHVGDGKIAELDRAAQAAMSRDDRDALDRHIYERATLGFQYRYEGIGIPAADDTAAQGALARFARFMASPPLLAALSAIIGRDGLSFAEGQATAYSPGDFLTRHDDAVKGRNRVAAFVLGMTPQWRPDWGGLLMFHADDDSRTEAHVQRFNTLDLFAVPQPHSVSCVSPAAPGRRLALTGWLRTEHP